MQVHPPKYIFGDTYLDPAIPDEYGYWPPGLPFSRSGVAELLRCDARSHDYFENLRLRTLGLPPLKVSTFVADMLYKLADTLDDDMTELARRIPRQRNSVAKRSD